MSNVARLTILARGALALSAPPNHDAPSPAQRPARKHTTACACFTRSTARDGRATRTATTGAHQATPTLLVPPAARSQCLSSTRRLTALFWVLGAAECSTLRLSCVSGERAVLEVDIPRWVPLFLSSFLFVFLCFSSPFLCLALLESGTRLAFSSTVQFDLTQITATCNARHEGPNPLPQAV